MCCYLHRRLTCSRLAAAVSDRFPSAGNMFMYLGMKIQARSCSKRQLNNKAAATSRQHSTGIKGSEMRPGQWSLLHAVVPAMLIRVGYRCTASSTRNRESAPGSPNPRGAHSHPKSSHGCRPLRMQELLRNATTPFSSFPHLAHTRPRGPATAPGAACSNGPLPMGHVLLLHHVPAAALPPGQPPHPFRLSSPVQ